MQLQIHHLFRPRQANGRVAANQYMEITPSPELASFVSCYWFSEPAAENRENESLESHIVNGVERVDRVLPDGCGDIIFEQDLKRNVCRTLICGVLEMPFTIIYNEQRPMRKFGIRFLPGALYSLLGIPQHELTNSHYDVDAVWAGFANEVEGRIYAEPLFENKVKIMEKYLISLASTRTILNDSLVNNLLYRIFVTKGNVSVQELADREGISARQMNRIFHRWVGTNPKRFSEVVRFQAIIQDMKGSLTVNRGFVYHNGYFDQAHMIREFKRFYGAPPSVAIREFNSMSRR